MTTKSTISILSVVAAFLMLAVSCGKYSQPKPYGYYRISLPDTSYNTVDDSRLPYSFSMSNNAIIQHRDTNGWMDIVYPALNAKIYCTYHRVNNNLRQLSDDANGFIYKHAVMADAIPEQGFENPDNKVYGVFYDLQGNTASPIQVVLTDSTKHFFRAALYYYCTPNQDSLEPVTQYMRQDIRHMVETFQWK